MSETLQDLDRLIRLPELIRITGLSRPTIYRLIKKGRFPPPVEISDNCKAWFASRVKSWQDGLKQAEVEPVGPEAESRRRRA